MRSPEGSMLTNESVCEVMLSCFKVCFEPRLNELLSRSAEQALKDMVLLLFMRLLQFADDRTESGMQQKRSSKMAVSQENLVRSQSYKGSDLSNVGVEEQRKISTQSAPGDEVQQQNSATPGHLHQLKAPPLATTPATPAGNIVDLQGKITQTPTRLVLWIARSRKPLQQRTQRQMLLRYRWNQLHHPQTPLKMKVWHHWYYTVCSAFKNCFVS
ncbi:uncharacterized protein [Musca autumnalis]|uniref:uncharacterized protein n=1 Tax=Musca autumnalis TaxID=221902 RepID=UPI003CF7BC90